MYRICDVFPKSLSDEYSMNVERNCNEWQKLTSEEIPFDDIYQAVYKMTMEELETVAANRSVVYENRFVEWITKRDTAILDFLLNMAIMIVHSTLNYSIFSCCFSRY